MFRSLSFIALVLCMCLALSGPVGAQMALEEPQSVLEEFSAEADTIEERLATPQGLTDQSIQQRRAELESWRQTLLSISTSLAAEVDPLQAQLDLLGAPEDGVEEPLGIVEKRQELTGKFEQLRAVQRRADQAAARAATLNDRLNRLRRDRFTDQLLNRGASPISIDQLTGTLDGLTREFTIVLRELTERIAVRGMMESAVDRLTLLAILGLVSIFIAVIARRWLLRRIQIRANRDLPRGRRIWLAAGATLARFLLPALAVVLLLVGLVQSDIAGPVGKIYITEMARGMGVVIGVYALSGAFYAPGAPSMRLSHLTDAAAVRVHRWVVLLALVVALNRVLVRGGEEADLPLSALNVINAGLLAMGGLLLWRFVHCSGLGKDAPPTVTVPIEDPDGSEENTDVSPIRFLARAARLLILAVAFVAPILALVGYFAASRFVFYPAIQSIAIIGLAVFIYSVICEIADATGERRAPENQEPNRVLSIVPVITGFLLFVLAAPVLSLVWGASTTDLTAIWAHIVEGFKIGDVTISPVDFLFFIVVFGIGYVLTRILQGVLRRSVLPLTRLDAGAKSAIQAGVGYLGVVTSALIAISATGLDLSNIAIVAGALSVGIGFGLQNIVNNFVSGVILLIERPIKTGDWVELNGVHGTVQRVNVRSTEIQTFDRSTMFVPNADLISGTVTNWTHANNQGRLIVPVGVAYGTDVRKVEKILTEIAQAHPMLQRRPAPYVIFTGFGADSLDFEIRGVLRDVNWILNVASEIRFSIYERFTEDGIEIPFAQRDLHIKNIGELGRAIRGQLAGGGEHEALDTDGSDISAPGQTPPTEPDGNGGQ